MVSWPVIFVILVLPLVGALFITLVRGDGVAESRNARWVALYTTLITFAVSLVLVWRASSRAGPPSSAACAST